MTCNFFLNIMIQPNLLQFVVHFIVQKQWISAPKIDSLYFYFLHITLSGILDFLKFLKRQKNNFWQNFQSRKTFESIKKSFAYNL